MIDNYEVDGSIIPPNFEGDFQAVFQVIKNDEILTGYNFFVKILR